MPRHRRNHCSSSLFEHLVIHLEWLVDGRPGSERECLAGEHHFISVDHIKSSVQQLFNIVERLPSLSLLFQRLLSCQNLGEPQLLLPYLVRSIELLKPTFVDARLWEPAMEELTSLVQVLVRPFPQCVFTCQKGNVSMLELVSSIGSMLKDFLLVSSFAEVILFGPHQLPLMFNTSIPHERDGFFNKFGNGCIAHICYFAI